MLSLLVFIFEGVRDAFDPRKTFVADGNVTVDDAAFAAAKMKATQQ
jgi:microcin C transport system permease protein